MGVGEADHPPVAEQAACFRRVYDTGGRYVNDHAFVRDADGRMHLFHITGPAGRRCYASDTELTFGHAVSRDLRSWAARPDVLHVDPASDHEPHHLFAPYVVAAGDRYHLFYAGVNRERRVEAMCRALSTDLDVWEKDAANPVFRPSPAWAEYRPGSATWACCRDAHVLRHEAHGWILYYVTWIAHTGGAQVAIGAAVSSDLSSWQDAGPVLVRPRATGRSTESMESPCVVARGGRYHMFYKHHDETRWIVSEDPLRFPDAGDRWFSVAHAAEVFEAQPGCWYISSCSRLPDDVTHTRSDRSRGLYLAGLIWEGDTPRVTPLPPG